MSEKSEKNSWDLLDKSRKFKDNLLRLLREDKDVRQEIFSLVNTVERSTQIKENVLNQEDAADMHIEDSEKSEEFSDLIRKQEIEINNLKKECKNKELQFQLIKEDSLKKIKEYKHIVSELTEKNKQCESDKNKYFMALDTMDAKYKKLQQEYNQIETEMRQLKTESLNAVRCAESFQKNYGKLDDMYQKYLGLGENIQLGLQRVLSPDGNIAQTAEIFFGYGIQEDNLESLWSMIAMNYSDYDKVGKLQDLVNIFCYFLEIHKKVTYKIVNYFCPLEGEEYDERKHTRTSESNATGKIAKVILPGFEIGKNISKKALVYVQ